MNKKQRINNTVIYFKWSTCKLRVTHIHPLEYIHTEGGGCGGGGEGEGREEKEQTRILDQRKRHLRFQKLENKRKGIGSAKPHGDERQRNRKEATAVTRFRIQVFEERVMRQKMKPELMEKRRTGGLTGGKRREGSREKAAGQ